MVIASNPLLLQTITSLRTASLWHFILKSVGGYSPFAAVQDVFQTLVSMMAENSLQFSHSNLFVACLCPFTRCLFISLP